MIRCSITRHVYIRFDPPCYGSVLPLSVERCYSSLRVRTPNSSISLSHVCSAHVYSESYVCLMTMFCSSVILGIGLARPWTSLTVLRSSLIRAYLEFGPCSRSLRAHV